MVKGLLTILVFISFCSGYGQQKDVFGRIYYGYIPLTRDFSNSEPKQNVKDFFQKIDAFSKGVEFELRFRNRVSLFKLVEKMELEMSEIAKEVVIGLVSKGSYYVNFEKDLLMRKTESMGEEFIIKSSLSTMKWKLSGETKKINGFNCFKATTSVIFENSKGSFESIIEAWYTPEIPVSFGPKQFNGLPGLILELKDRRHLFYTIKVELNPINLPPIDPFNGIVISEKNFKNKLKEMRSFYLGKQNKD